MSYLKLSTLFFNKNSSYSLLLYIGIFTVFFFQFPKNNSLPGNCDTGLIISLSNAYINDFKRAILNEEIGHSMYPVTDEHAYGESAPGSALLFIIPKLILQNDIYASFVLIVLIFSFNGWTVYLLSKFLGISTKISFFVGFIFSYNNFAFANIDDSILFFYVIPIISFIFLKSALNTNRKLYFYLGSIFWGLQAYFSIYVFVFLTISILILFFKRDNILFLLKAFLICLITSLPIFCVYFYTYLRNDFWMPPEWDFDSTALGLSLGVKDLARKLPGAFSLYELDYSSAPYYVRTRSVAYIGVLTYLLGFGYILKGNISINIKILILTFFLFPFGVFHFLFILVKDVPVLNIFYEMLKFIRVPLRAYFVVLLVFSILSGKMLMMLHRKYYLNIVLFFVFCFHLVDATPLSIRKYRLEKYLSAPNHLFTFVKSDDTVLFLPSNDYYKAKGDTVDLNPGTRDIIYMNWQTQLECNVLNGMNGYLPIVRQRNQLLIDRMQNSDSLSKLIHLNKLDYIVYDKRFILNEKDTNQLADLFNSNYIEHKYSFANQEIFKVKEIK